jgi:hypothetical protein
MGPVEAIVARCFRDEPSGRAVVFPGDKRGRGYLIKSAADEQKITAFLRLYFSAHCLILVLGYCLAYESSMQLAYAFGRPALHLLRSIIVFLAIYAAVAGLPYYLFWRTFKKTRLSFVLPQDEIQVVGRRSMHRQALRSPVIAAIVLLIIAGVLFALVQFK